MSVLEVKDLTVSYGQKEIIKKLSFTVESGETLAVLGPNGVGKTTLVRALTGILPFQGEVSYFGRDLKKYTRKELARKVAVVNQRQEMTVGFKVREAVALGRLPHIRGRESQRDYEVVEEVLKLTHLEELALKTLDTISGGELARVALARALAQEPELLILDEPTAHLDMGHIALLTQLFLKIKQKKKLSCLLIIHDISLAALLSDHLMLFGEDDKIFIGQAKEVLTEEILEDIYGVENLVTVNPLDGQKTVFWNLGGR